MSDNQKIVQALIYSAIDSPLGILVETNDPKAFRANYYSVRAQLKKRGITEAEDIQIRNHPDDPNKLLLINKALVKQNQEPEHG